VIFNHATNLDIETAGRSLEHRLVISRCAGQGACWPFWRCFRRATVPSSTVRLRSGHRSPCYAIRGTLDVG
jgi:hypothetical protein